jgi:DNA-binding beta-propeller fold protein YncE
LFDAGSKGPSSVAVDSAGNLYVADFRSSRVLKLAAGASRPTTVDADGTVYATSFHNQCTGTHLCAFSEKTGRSGDGRVLKLTQGSSTPSVLPFSGLDRLWDVAVDTAGEVYVTESGDRVVKLPVQR